MILGGNYMAYLVATNRNRQGCFAIAMDSPTRLNGLDEYLTDATLGTGIQIVVISSPEAYQEYAPYEILTSERAFINQTLDMAESACPDKKPA